MAELSGGSGWTGHPSISVAWLLISHGTFLGAAIAATGLSIGLIAVLFVDAFQRAHDRIRRLAIAWNVASFLISLWTLYAISATWTASHLWPRSQRIFGDFGFASLCLVTLVIALFNLWTLHTVYRWRTCTTTKNKKNKKAKKKQRSKCRYSTSAL